MQVGGDKSLYTAPKLERLAPALSQAGLSLKIWAAPREKGPGTVQFSGRNMPPAGNSSPSPTPVLRTKLTLRHGLGHSGRGRRA